MTGLLKIEFDDGKDELRIYPSCPGNLWDKNMCMEVDSVGNKMKIIIFLSSRSRAALGERVCEVLAQNFKDSNER